MTTGVQATRSMTREARVRWQFPILALLAVAAACGNESGEGSAAAMRAPAAGAELMNVEVTTLIPGPDTSVLTLRNPYENDKVAAAEGRTFFNAFNCSGCHAPLGGGGMGPPLSDTLWVYGGEPGNVYLSIVQGRPNGMPAWNNLPPDVVWKLVSYIHTLPEEKKLVATGGP